MTDEFVTVVGKFIHHCGALEFLVNNSIRTYSDDYDQASKAVNQPLSNRIGILQKLLTEKSDIEKEDIDHICSELHDLRVKRNAVAHNPIVASAPDESAEFKIMVLRYRNEKNVEIPDELTKDDVGKLVGRSSKLALRIMELIPDSNKT